MAASLPRPGVEVIQAFRSTSPTIVTPTLVPCNVAPFFELIEVLKSDGTINSEAKLGTQYQQLGLTVTQSSFPSPRGNIDQVNVLEETIRVFFQFGGALLELSQTAGFLTSLPIASQPSVVGTGVAPFDVDGKTLIFQFDAHTAVQNTAVVPGAAHFLSANDVTVTFVGNTLTIDDIVSQINAVLPDVASDDGAGSLKLTSTLYGAGASVLVRSTGGANLELGFSILKDQVAVGRGLYARDDSNGDMLSARIEEFAGSAQRDIDVANTGTPSTNLFNAASIKPGDICVADGVNIGEINTVTNTRLTMAVEQNIFGALSPFHPRYFWVQAQNLTYPAPAASVGAALTGSNQTAAATPAFLVAPSEGTFPIGPGETFNVDVIVAGVEQPTVSVSSAGGWTDLAAAIAAINAIAPAVPFEAYPANVAGDEVASEYITLPGTWTWGGTTTVLTTDTSGVYVGDFIRLDSDNQWFEISAITPNTDVTILNPGSLVIPTGATGSSKKLAQRLGLRTKADNTGSLASISLSNPSGGMTVGFGAGPYTDVGENIRYLVGTWAKKTSTLWVGGTGSTAGQTVIYNLQIGGVAPTGAPETVTWGGSYANTSAGLDLAVANWNSQVKFTEAYRSTSAGVPSAAGTYLSIRTRGENLGALAKVQVTGGTATPANFTVDGAYLVGVDTDINSANFQWSLDYNPHVYDVTFTATEDDGGTSLQSVINKINSLTPGVASASSDSPPYLVLTSGMVGEPSQVLVGSGTANGFTGVGGLGFTNAQEAQGDGRPLPDLSIDLSGNVVIQNQILREGLTGVPFDPGWASIYLAYKALRLDVSPDADTPKLLVINGVTELNTIANPISTDNPGALMCYLTALNAPGSSIAAVGVPEVSSDAPDGTPLGYAKCFEFLESQEVYAIATASQINVVHQAGLTHVNYMSEPEQKGERIYFFNPPLPTRALPTLIGSGTDINSTVTPGKLTLDVNIAPALIEAGINPGVDINPTSGAIVREVYLDLGGDDNFYLIQKVENGTTVYLRVSFVTGDGNDDGFYATSFPSTVISDNWTVAIRGRKLVVTGTTKPDKQGMAETIQAAASAYGFRRGFWVHPDQCGINVTGLEQLVKGYYASAAIIGMVANLAPQQGFTNFPITGLTRVVGSNDYFTEKQLNIIAGGGVYILVQDAEGAPVVCRHQLSTDLKSIETRELSITKVVDFTSKFMRTGLRNFIGRSNITQPFIDQLGTVVEGLFSFLKEHSVLIGADVNNLIQDADAPDTILIDATLDVPFPCNYIRLTLVV